MKYAIECGSDPSVASVARGVAHVEATLAYMDLAQRPPRTGRSGRWAHCQPPASAAWQSASEVVGNLQQLTNVVPRAVSGMKPPKAIIQADLVCS